MWVEPLKGVKCQLPGGDALGDLIVADGHRESGEFARNSSVGCRNGEVKKIPQRPIYERVFTGDEGVIVAPKFKAVEEGGSDAGVQYPQYGCTPQAGITPGVRARSVLNARLAFVIQWDTW